MRVMRENKGYTLLEMVITIAIIGIAIGMTTFGLSSIFNSNVRGKATDVTNEIRKIQVQQMSSTDKDYLITITHDGDNYNIKTKLTDGTVLKTIELPKTFHFMKYDGSNYIEIDTITDTSEITFKFDKASGEILTSAAGMYKISADNANVEVEFVVVKENGRIYIE